MQFTGLAESQFGISSEELEAIIAPFVTRTFAAGDPEWETEIQQRKKKILRKYLRQKMFGWLPSQQRSEQTIVTEYTKAWQESEYLKYSLSQPLSRISPWEWRGQRMFASDIGATRFRQRMLIGAIEHLCPKRVVEVGCGNGINLLMLACRFPDIEFTGIELTKQGHQAATRFQELPELPEELQKYAPLSLPDPTAFKRIRFLQGTAANLPFDNDSIDLVFTVLAIEQMERIRAGALTQIARVAKRHTLMIEPFRDVNDSGWPRRNVVRRNYFQGRIDDLSDYGLEPQMAVKDFPQEVFLKVCAVQAEKRSS